LRRCGVAASREAGFGLVFNAENGEKDWRTLKRAEAEALVLFNPRAIKGLFHATTRRRDENH
jgi:hypothetical protein